MVDLPDTRVHIDVERSGIFLGDEKAPKMTGHEGTKVQVTKLAQLRSDDYTLECSNKFPMNIFISHLFIR